LTHIGFFNIFDWVRISLRDKFSGDTGKIYSLKIFQQQIKIHISASKHPFWKISGGKTVYINELAYIQMKNSTI
jgi:hypothetical protein